MPPDFPSEVHDDVNDTVSAALGDTNDVSSWAEFAGGWNGVAFRFCECAKHADAFTVSIQEHGDSPPHHIRAGLSGIGGELYVSAGGAPSTRWWSSDPISSIWSSETSPGGPKISSSYANGPSAKKIE